MSRGGVIDESSVLSDHAIEQHDLWKKAHEVRKLSTGNQDHPSPRLFYASQCVTCLERDNSIMGKGAIVVDSEG
jgi:hypothetical protein